MRKECWIPGLALGGLGALFAFALKHDSGVLDFVRLRPFGLVLLVIGALFLLWGFLEWRFSHRPPERRQDGSAFSFRINEIRTIGGLVAVALGVGAVAALTIIAITTVSSLDATSTVALSTSAFGVISAVVGAFIGIKIGTDQADKAAGATTTAATAVGAATAQLNDAQKEKVKKDVADAAAITQTSS